MSKTKIVRIPIVLIKETGIKLHKIRKAHNLSRKEIAFNLHTAYSTVSNWENGHKLPQVNSLVTFSKIYKLPIQSLLSLDYNNGYDIEVPLSPSYVHKDELKDLSMSELFNILIIDEDNKLCNGECSRGNGVLQQVYR